MKKRRLICISVLVVCMVCMLIYNVHAVWHSKKFEKTVLDILSKADSWQELLLETVTEQSVSEELTKELLSEDRMFIRAIEYKSQYSGIYLVTKRMLPQREGILISSLDIEPISLERNTGTEIEWIGSSDGLFLYRLHYYWD